MHDDAYRSMTASRYSAMADHELQDLALNSDELTEASLTLLRAEFERRTLAMPAPRVKPAPPPNPPAEAGYIPEPAAPEPAALDDVPTDEPGGTLHIAGPLVTVGAYRDLSEAFVARAVLEGAGIDCFLRDEHTIRMDWTLSNMLGGARLQVAPEDAAAANELLSQPISASFPVDSGPDFEQPRCPNCASLDVVEDDMERKIRATSMLVPFFTGFTGLLAGARTAFMRKDVWKCNACGCRWADDASASSETAS